MAGLFLPGFTIWRRSRVSNGSGQFTETFADTGQTVSGRLSPLSASELFMVEQKTGRITHRFSCDSSVNILVGDEVRGGAQSVTVDAIRTTSTGRRKECLCVSDQRAT